MSRSQSFSDFERGLDVTFTEVWIEPMVGEILSQEGNQVTVSVYESTVIEYLASEDAVVTDIMGYGTDHVMTLELVGGEYQVVADSYDERLVTGACSADMAAKPIGGNLNAEDVAVLQSMEVESGGETVSPAAVTSSSYNVNAAINYANEWCGVAGAKIFSDYDGVEEESDTSLYNPAYKQYPDADCANFVSQCLAAGGLAQDSTWRPEEDAWVNAKKLHFYLRDVKKFAAVSANNSTVFPGNPVYWYNGKDDDADDYGGETYSGHQMICTGYNSAGEAVVNGHNFNMFRVPISAFSGRSLMTDQIVGGDVHICDVSYNEYRHYGTCKFCQTSYDETHIFVPGSGGTAYCNVCGYVSPYGYNSVEAEKE